MTGAGGAAGRSVGSGAAVRYRVSHRTGYAYSRPMTDGYTLAYLLPRPTPHQVVERAEVDVEPEPDERAERVDVFGNRVLQVGIHRSHESLVLHATSAVAVAPADVGGGGDDGGGGGGGAWERVAAAVAAQRGGAALTVRPLAGSSPYVSLPDHGRALVELGAPAFAPGRPLVGAARDLCHLIHDTFEYDPESTDTSTPLGDVLAMRRGVCQDFAHLAAGALRARGLAARYVSGYVETDPPPGRGRLVGADASHAWCSVWVPGSGWIDFDPTNDRLPTHRHITVAWGRDYGDVAPARGVVIGPRARQQLTVAVDVTRLDAGHLGADGPTRPSGRAESHGWD